MVLFVRNNRVSREANTGQANSSGAPIASAVPVPIVDTVERPDEPSVLPHIERRRGVPPDDAIVRWAGCRPGPAGACRRLVGGIDTRSVQ